MFDRIIASCEGRGLPGGQVGEAQKVSPTHQQWMENLLTESPASVQSIPLGNSDDGELTMEWQAVFMGAGVAYVRLRGIPVAVCLLLEGRFLSSENAAVDAVQQTLVNGKSRGPGFDMVRKHRGRPLRAIVLLEENLKPALVRVLDYWSDCLGNAYFRSLSPIGAASQVDAAGEQYPFQVL